MKNFTLILIQLAVFHSAALEAQIRKENSERTPVAERSLSNLPPDYTFNDAPSILEIIEDNVNFDMFNRALYSTEMIEELKDKDEITVFAPHNSAFARLSEERLDFLKTPNGAGEMQKILKYHIVMEEYDQNTLRSTILLNEGVLRLKTLQGGYLAFTLMNGKIFITDELGNQFEVNKAGLEAENGVVHSIDMVLLPK